MTKYGPESTCQRDGCAEREAHKAKVHLDPRHEWYDGPSTTLNAMSQQVRKPALRIIEKNPDVMPEVMDLVHHIQSIDDQKANALADTVRREREAMVRASDCQEHGRQIEEHDRRIAAYERGLQSADTARIALLDLLWYVQSVVNSYRANPNTWTLPGIVDTLDKAAQKSDRAHMKAHKGRQ